ncbi:hypothetical protein [Piscirickettsia salmonis]|nr:hypothetical protein [Piscirickettsia salmonis]
MLQLNRYEGLKDQEQRNQFDSHPKLQWIWHMIQREKYLLAP